MQFKDAVKYTIDCELVGPISEVEELVGNYATGATISYNRVGLWEGQSEASFRVEIIAASNVEAVRAGFKLLPDQSHYLKDHGSDACAASIAHEVILMLAERLRVDFGQQAVLVTLQPIKTCLVG